MNVLKNSAPILAAVQVAGRGHSQNNWPQTEQKDIPYHTASCVAYKVGQKEGREKTFGVKVSFFPSHCYMQWNCFLGNGWTPAQQWEAVNSFLVSLCLCAQLLFSPINLPVSQPITSVFFALILYPILPWGKWILSYVGLNCTSLHLFLKLKTLTINYAVLSAMCQNSFWINWPTIKQTNLLFILSI